MTGKRDQFIGWKSKFKIPCLYWFGETAKNFWELRKFEYGLNIR